MEKQAIELRPAEAQDPDLGPVSARSFSLAPRNLTEAMEFAKIMANSDLVPKDFKGKADNVLVAVQMGAELGLQPMQALQNIAVINGRPSVWGDAALALVKTHHEFRWIVEEPSKARAAGSLAGALCAELEPDAANAAASALLEGVPVDAAVCVVSRLNQPVIVRWFSQQMAITAGLAGKEGPWKQYPERMRQLRARGFALRDAFPDKLRGLGIREEVEDYVDIPQPEPGAPHVQLMVPRRKSTPAPEQVAPLVDEDPALVSFRAALDGIAGDAMAAELSKLADQVKAGADKMSKPTLDAVRKLLSEFARVHGLKWSDEKGYVPK